jgi:hypothetical protein
MQHVIYGIIATVRTDNGTHEKLIYSSIHTKKVMRKAFEYQSQHPEAKVSIRNFYNADRDRGFPYIERMQDSRFLLAVGEKGHSGRRETFDLFWGTHSRRNLMRFVHDAVSHGTIDPTKLSFRLYQEVSRLTPGELYEFLRSRNRDTLDGRNRKKRSNSDNRQV